MLPPAGTQRTIIRPIRHTFVNHNFQFIVNGSPLALQYAYIACAVLHMNNECKEVRSSIGLTIKGLYCCKYTSGSLNNISSIY